MTEMSRLVPLYVTSPPQTHGLGLSPEAAARAASLVGSARQSLAGTAYPLVGRHQRGAEAAMLARRCARMAFYNLLRHRPGHHNIALDTPIEDIPPDRDLDDAARHGQLVLINVDDPDDVVFPTTAQGLIRGAFHLQSHRVHTDPDTWLATEVPALQDEAAQDADRYYHILTTRLDAALDWRLEHGEPVASCAGIRLIDALMDSLPGGAVYLAVTNPPAGTYSLDSIVIVPDQSVLTPADLADRLG